MGIHQCPFIVRSCKWLDINSFIHTLHDVLRYLGTHWHQWWDCHALVNDIHQSSVFQWLLSMFDVDTFSHGKNCNVGFCSRWRLYIFHDRHQQFYSSILQPYESTTVLLSSRIFYFIQPSRSSDPSHLAAISTTFLLYSSSAFWVRGGMLFSNI